MHRQDLRSLSRDTKVHAFSLPTSRTYPFGSPAYIVRLQLKDELLWATRILGIQKAWRHGHSLSGFQSLTFTVKPFIDLNFLTHKNAVHHCHDLRGHSFATSTGAPTQRQRYPLSTGSAKSLRHSKGIWSLFFLVI